MQRCLNFDLNSDLNLNLNFDQLLYKHQPQIKSIQISCPLSLSMRSSLVPLCASPTWKEINIYLCATVLCISVERQPKEPMKNGIGSQLKQKKRWPHFAATSSFRAVGIGVSSTGSILKIIHDIIVSTAFKYHLHYTKINSKFNKPTRSPPRPVHTPQASPARPWHPRGARPRTGGARRSPCRR